MLVFRFRTLLPMMTVVTAAVVVCCAQTPVLAAGVAAPLPVPKVPVAVTVGVRFTVSGVAGTADATEGAGTTSVTILHSESGAWVPRGTFAAASAVTSTTIRYAASIALPSPGRWRLRVNHSTTGASTAYAFTAWIRAGNAPDAIVWNRDGALTIPEAMAYRGNARQMIVVTGARLGSTHGTLRLFVYRDGDWVQRLSTPARFGTYGLVDGLKRRQGSRTTPTGIWRAAAYAFGTHAAAPAGSRLPYRRIGPNSWWSAVRGATYNTWVETRRAISGERLANAPVQYEWAFSSGYNERPNPQVYGRGTAIFVHCFGRGSVLTAGCVSIDHTRMAALIAALDPKLVRMCAIGTEQSTGATSVYSY